MKCSMGKACHLAHGWLEVIYHPLLYKTKLCQSTLKKGVCSEYGIYCTKAHNENEIRNLVKIYGKEWKRHYEAYQIFQSEKPSSKKSKCRRVNRDDVTCSSHSQGAAVEDYCPFMENVATSDFSSQMYGGSPLFVPTPSESPLLDSTAECSEPLESFRLDYLPSSDLNGIGCKSTFWSGDVGEGTEPCNKKDHTPIINPPDQSSSSSFFDDCFPWTHD